MAEANIDEIIQRLKKISGVETDKGLAHIMGVPPGRIQAWRHRDSINCKEIISFCIDQQYSLDYVFKGPDHPNHLTEPNITRATNNENANYNLCVHADAVIPPVTLPSLGGNDQQIVNTLHISREWIIHVLAMSPSDIALVRIIGNNMMPWASDGDIVIIDTRQTNIISDAPFILQYGNILVPRRLHRLPDGTITAYSDNSYSKEEIYTEETMPPVVGRIVRRLVR